MSVCDTSNFNNVTLFSHQRITVFLFLFFGFRLYSDHQSDSHLSVTFSLVGIYDHSSGVSIICKTVDAVMTFDLSLLLLC